MSNSLSSGTLSSNYQVVLKRIREIPSLPDLITQVLEAINRPVTPASEIAKLIAYDPGLTSKVLRMVNSAAYGFQRQISSIQHAIMILGFNTVRGLVLSASIFKLFEGHTRPGGLNHTAFWEHSFATAIAARMLAKALRISDADDVFSAAILHDIGKVVLDIYFERDYEKVLKVAETRGIVCHGIPFYQLEHELLGVTHCGIGHFLANKWKLPVAINEVIQFHHEPEYAEHYKPLVYLVALANEMAVLKQEKAGVFDETHFTPELLAFFNVSTEDLMGYTVLLNEELEHSGALLDSMSSLS
ncbi:MAG: HDOD domain-containing protein [Cyanobacteria bacterium P01_H01_bin.74]